MEILDLIRSRHSSRWPFTDKKIKQEDLNLILEAARWAPSAHNMQNFEIIVIDDPELLKELGKIKAPPSEAFIRENFEQLRTLEELKRKKVGILGTNFPKDWQKKETLDKAVKEMTPTELNYTIKNSPCILIVLYDTNKRAPASKNDVLGFLSLGAAMENMWLMAESLNISFQIMSVFSNVNLKSILNIPKNLEIAYAIRLGYAEKPDYLRVRRNQEDFTHHNLYANS